MESESKKPNSNPKTSSSGEPALISTSVIAKPAGGSRCRLCGKEGHKQNNCPDSRPGTSSSSSSREGTSSAVVCQYCNQPGHNSRNCLSLVAKIEKRPAQQNESRRGNKDADTRPVSRGGRSTPLKSSSPGPNQYGIVVSIKDTFGFLRGFGREDDLFFPLEGLDVKVGQEVSFAVRGNERAGGKPMAVQVAPLANGSFLQMTKDAPQEIKEPDFARGEILSVGKFSGSILITNNGGVAVFDMEPMGKTSTELTPGITYTFKIARDPSTQIWIALPPFYDARHGMNVGKVVRLPSSDPGLIEGRDPDFKTVKLPRESIDTRGPEIRVGDVVWFDMHRKKDETVAGNVLLCTPDGEVPFYEEATVSEEKDEKKILKDWLFAKETSLKRVSGTIISLRDTFAFIKMDRDTLFMPYSELCVPTSGFRKSMLKVGTFVTFEIKRSSSAKDSDVAIRVFPLSGSLEGGRSTSSTRRHQAEVLLKENVEGRVVEVSDNGEVKMIEYDGLAALEAPELFEELKALKPGEEVDLSGRGLGIRSLAPTYCKWLNGSEPGAQLTYDERLYRVRKNIDEKEEKTERKEEADSSFSSSKNTRHTIPCSSLATDARAFKVGDSILFDLLVRVPAGKRVGYVIPVRLESRQVILRPGEVEKGIVLHGGLIASSRRMQPLTMDKSSTTAKVGDVVSFQASEDRKRGWVASEIQVLTDLNPSELGLESLVHDRSIKVRGTVARRMAKVIRGAASSSREGKSDPTSAVVLISSGTPVVPSGLIIIGKEPKFDAPAEEPESTVVDWRRENELLRTVRGCKERPMSADEPLHVFQTVSKNEMQVIEKETRKLGLSSKIKASAMAIGRNKQAVNEWASKVGRKVSVPPFGVGIVSDCRFREEYGAILTVRLFPAMADIGEAVGALLYCVDSPAKVTYIRDDNEELSTKQNKQRNDEEEMEIARWSASLRGWAQSGARPVEAVEMRSPSRAVFRSSPALIEALIRECLLFKEDRVAQTVLVSCDTSEQDLIIPPDASEFVGQFGFLYTGETSAASFFPIEGDTVEFTPCRSLRTGILRASNIQLVKAQGDRVTGTVEELSGKGGWVRPQGKLAAEFTTSEVLSRVIAVGDIVDFKLSEKGDKATRVRVIQPAPPSSQQSSTPAREPSPASKEPPAARPRINQELIANAPTATSAAASKTAAGPDGTIGFTKEKWRGKRLLTNLNVTAPEFKPSTPLLSPSPEPLTVLANAKQAESPLPTSTKSSSKLKIRAEAPVFVPPGFVPPKLE